MKRSLLNIHNIIDTDKLKARPLCLSQRMEWIEKPTIITETLSSQKKDKWEETMKAEMYVSIIMTTMC